MAYHMRLDASILQFDRRLGIVLFSVVGLTVALILGGCSNSEAGQSSEAIQGRPPSSAPTESTAPDTNAGGATATNPTTSPSLAEYQPATAQGPAENVPLPVMPELAKQESKEGLEAFAEHWYALANYGFETGDPGPIQAISDPNCTVCGNVYKMLDSGFTGNDWMVGGKLHVISKHSSFELTSKGQFQVLVQLSQDQYEFRGPEGQLYGSHEGFDLTTVQMIEATYTNGWFAHDVVTIQ